MRLDRFSDYAAQPASYGWHNVRPLQAYRYLYPFPEASLRRIAYAFEYDWEPGREPAGYVAAVKTAVEAWRAEPDDGEPRLATSGSGTTVADSRNGSYGVRRLDAVEAAVIRECDGISSRDELTTRLGERLPLEPNREARIDEVLESLVAEHLMVRDGDRYLSLALPETVEVHSGA